MIRDDHSHTRWFSPEGEASSVKGFLTPLASEFISFLLSYQLDEGIEGNIAEIGTYMGRTFVGLALASREGEVVLGVDLFPEEVASGFRRSLQLLPPAVRSRVLAIRQNTAQMTSANWMSSIKKSARFLHIDGGHNHFAIVADMHHASASLAPRALVVLDDYMHDWYPDLTEGIHDALRASRNIAPIAIIPRLGSVTGGGTKLVCGNRDGAELYRGLLEKEFADRMPQRRSLCGHPVLTFQRT
jgi:hypothetical protein